MVARSLTAAEKTAIARRQWGCVLAPFGALGLWLAAALAFDPPRREGDALAIAGLLLLLPVLMALAMRRRSRGGADESDPEVTVEIASDGVTIAADGRLRRLTPDEAAARFSTFLRGRAGTFDGLLLDLPGRPIALGSRMRGGLDAAAALAALWVASGAWRDPG